ncbi:hypothetical protein J1N35_021737, partial [Gossypium stocksii]
TMLLLCSLPSSYKSFRETLIYEKDKLSFKDVNSHLLSKDKLDNEFGSDSKAHRQASILEYQRSEIKVVAINLISSSILDSKGYRINIESSGIKVSRGALVLLKVQDMPVEDFAKDDIMEIRVKMEIC